MNLGPRIGNEYTDCIEWAADHAKNGFALEFGVASGRTLRIIADRMKVVGFDSFEGLPEDWREGFSKGTFACEPPEVQNAYLIAGWFDETLPKYVEMNKEILDSVSLVHIDCDLYSSTKTILDNLGPQLAPGTLIVFDEYHGYPGWEDHEAKAWDEFVEGQGIRYCVEGHGPEQLVVKLL